MRSLLYVTATDGASACIMCMLVHFCMNQVCAGRACCHIISYVQESHISSKKYDCRSRVSSCCLVPVVPVYVRGWCKAGYRVMTTAVPRAMQQSNKLGPTSYFVRLGAVADLSHPLQVSLLCRFRVVSLTCTSVLDKRLRLSHTGHT